MLSKMRKKKRDLQVFFLNGKLRVEILRIAFDSTNGKILSFRISHLSLLIKRKFSLENFLNFLEWTWKVVKIFNFFFFFIFEKILNFFFFKEVEINNCSQCLSIFSEENKKWEERGSKKKFRKKLGRINKIIQTKKYKF